MRVSALNLSGKEAEEIPVIRGMDRSSYQRDSHSNLFDNREGFFLYEKSMPQLQKMLEKHLEAERKMDAQDR